MLSASPRDSPGAVAAAIQSKTGAAGGVGGIGSRSNNNKQQTTATAAPGVSKDVLLGQQTALKVRERKFENGDRYRGGWLNGLPEGEGKYEWSDGSCYEGGWKAGHKHGVGKYTWNSGASYQGDWRNGFMHGVGTFEAPDGSKYQGGWCEDLKHGLGRKIYANGDVYEGLWFNGKPDGPGRYIWVDFNEYDGEWRAGRLHGQGTFVWKTGERYDGEWKAGQEDGVGMFTFRDGSTFEGFWHRGKKHGVGIFRPAAAAPRSLKGRFESGSHGRRTSSNSHAGLTGRSAFADATAAAAALPDEAAADYAMSKRPNKPVQESGGNLVDAAAAGGGGGGGGNQVNQPGSAKSLSSVGVDQRSLSALQSPRARRDQVMLKEYHEGRLVRQQVLSPQQVSSISSALSAAASLVDASNTTSGSGKAASSSRQQVTSLGEVMFKDHSAYDLMVQLQLGIRWSVTSAALDYTSPAALQTGLQPPDYATTITQEFPRAGSRSTPVHPAADFVWKDYAPAAFRMLREVAGVEQHDFINQLCGDQALRLLTPPAHSSRNMFLLSSDGRFLVRTISCAEKKLLLGVLQRYTEHMQRNPDSLLTRIYGLHRVSAPAGGGVRKKVRFIVMSNILCAGDAPIQRRYDLKGCTKGRTAGPAALKNPSTPNTVLKDLDLRQRFKLDAAAARALHDQLDADTRLLSSLRVMDYSMLVGVHQPTAGGAVGAVDGSKSAAAGVPQQMQQQQRNFAEHSTAADLAASVGRLEQQLPKLSLDKWAESALLQLGRANLLMGLAGASSKPGGGGGSSRRSSITRSPTLVLATRPNRSNTRRQALSSAGGTAAAAAAGGQPPGAAVGAGGAGAGSALRQPVGMGLSALAVPLTGGSSSKQQGGAGGSGASGPLATSKQQQQQEVVLYMGVIDFLQAYTVKKRLESYMRRLVSSANAISAVGPGFYAARFRRAMKKVFLSQGGASAAPP